MIIHERLALVSRLSLGQSRHQATDAPTDGAMCIMEAVAYVAGEPWSDSPACACPVISAFLRRWNDGLLTDAERARLFSPMIARMVGTKSTPAVEERRSYLALDWLIRVYTPTMLGLVPMLATHAIALRALPEIIDLTTAHAVSDTVRAAAGDAARTAARTAAWDAAWVADRAAAGPAAGDAAGDAAWDALASAAGPAARAAAVTAARAAARAAAGPAAGDAAWDALAPTVATLQESAAELVGRMLALTDAAAGEAIVMPIRVDQ